MSTETKAPAAGNDNVMAALATLPLIGLIMFYAMPKASHLVKSHAKQSNFHLAVAVINSVLGVVLSFTVVLACVPLIVGLVDFVLWVMQVIKALQGQEYKMPVVGDFFDKLLK